jgi:hypothetical protein
MLVYTKQVCNGRVGKKINNLTLVKAHQCISLSCPLKIDMVFKIIIGFVSDLIRTSSGLDWYPSRPNRDTAKTQLGLGKD